MKKLSIIFALFIVTISCKGNENKPSDSITNNSASKQDKLKRYQVESGIIEYNTKISGKIMTGSITGNGTEVRYFKNWGALELFEQKSSTTTHMVVMGNEMKESTSDHQMNKLDNGKSYTVDFKNNTIIETSDMAMEMIKNFQPNKDAAEVGKSILEGLGGKQIGEESFLGYNCEVWDLMGVKQWVYKGVTLKSEATVMGITTISEATKATFNTTIPNSKFELPNYPITKQESIMDLGEMDFDMNDMENIDADMEKLSKLSYNAWKKMALADKDDEEMQNMTEEELRQTYDMIQKMIKMRRKN